MRDFLVFRISQGLAFQRERDGLRPIIVVQRRLRRRSDKRRHRNARLIFKLLYSGLKFVVNANAHLSVFLRFHASYCRAISDKAKQNP